MKNIKLNPINNTTTDQNTNLKYAIRFGLLYLLILYLIRILSAVALVLFGIDFDGGEVGAILGSLVFVVRKFLYDNKRVPSKSERNKLVWLSLFAYWVVALVQHIIYLSINNTGVALLKFSSIKEFLTFAMVFITLSAIYLLVFYFAYGLYAKRELKTLTEKNKL